MSSSFSSLIFPTGYDGGSSVALVSTRALCVKQRDVPKWRLHAEAREEASSDAVKAPLTQSAKSKEAGSETSSGRSAGKGFGPRPPSPPPKPPKPSVSKDTKFVTTRRPAPTRPIAFRTPDPVIREQDNVFIVGLTVLGALIFVEGIAVAGSGLLPDELDAFVVKYVYPAFTPTVGLFLVGAVLYGVFKIRQGVGDEGDEPN